MKKSFKEFFKLNSDKDILIQFEGILTLVVLSSILSQVEEQLNKRKVKLKVLRKLYNLSVECLQNVYHHQSNQNQGGDFPMFFSLTKEENNFLIRSINRVSKDDKNYISSRINHVNGLSREEIVKEFRRILDNGVISSKGGSGLGFLDMARKSRNRLHYDFIKENNHHYFILTLKVTS